MNAEQTAQTALFTNADCLRLLQLLTRRAMAERSGKDAARAEGGGTASSKATEKPPSSEVPRRWRLVPEGVSLYDWQRECLPRWLDAGRGTVKVATGGGKTLFALAAAQQLQNEREPDLRLVVVVPTIPLMYQWHDEVRRGNLPGSAVGLMGGGQELASLDNLQVLICVLNSARERLPGLVQKAGWAARMLLVVDECHRANAQRAQRIFDAKPRYALGLSATPEQALEAESLPTDEAYETGVVGQALGPIICDFTIRESLAAGLLTLFEVWHIGLPLSTPEASEHARLSREITDLRKTLQIQQRRRGPRQNFLAWCQALASRGGPMSGEAERFIGLANRRKRLLYRAQARNDVALSILSESVTDPEARVIVFHESIEEIENLFLRAVQLGLPSVLEHSKLPDGVRDENIDAFRRGIAQVIISARSLVEGFNVPSADLGVIAASSSSVRQRIQSLGRMLRRKAGARSARIVVLSVRDTEDEAIYEKADWESVVGAERNRYFRWDPPETAGPWSTGLVETSTPPRTYRPPSWEVDVEALKPGDPYPGQTRGHDLHVDQMDNLRSEDGLLVNTTPELVAAILERNSHRRARATPAGHLIVHVGEKARAADWRFLGTVPLPGESAPGRIVRLRLKTSSGRRAIALEDERRRGLVRFALGPGSSRTIEAGEARDRLLEWIRSVEQTRRVQITDLFWDTKSLYWLEIGGERVEYDRPLAPLEFKE